MRCASAASGSERNHTPCAGEERREERKPSLGLVVEARHEDRALRHDLPHANVGQNRYGAKTSARYSSPRSRR